MQLDEKVTERVYLVCTHAAVGECGHRRPAAALGHTGVHEREHGSMGHEQAGARVVQQKGEACSRSFMIELIEAYAEIVMAV